MSIEEIKKDILIEANSFYDITTLKNKSVFEFNKYQLIKDFIAYISEYANNV